MNKLVLFILTAVNFLTVFLTASVIAPLKKLWSQVKKVSAYCLGGLSVWFVLWFKKGSSLMQTIFYKTYTVRKVTAPVQTMPWYRYCH